MSGRGLVGSSRGRAPTQDIKPVIKLRSVAAPLSDGDSDFGMDDEPDIIKPSLSKSKPRKASTTQSRVSPTPSSSSRPPTKRRRSNDPEDISYPRARPQPQSKRSAHAFASTSTSTSAAAHPSIRRSSSPGAASDSEPDPLETQPGDSLEFRAVKREERERERERVRSRGASVASGQGRAQCEPVAQGRHDDKSTRAKRERGGASDLDPLSEIDPDGLSDLELPAPRGANPTKGSKGSRGSDDDDVFRILPQKAARGARDLRLEADRSKLNKLNDAPQMRRRRKAWEPASDPWESNLAKLLGCEGMGPKRTTRTQARADASDSESDAAQSSQVLVGGVAIKRSRVPAHQLPNATSKEAAAPSVGGAGGVKGGEPVDSDATESEHEVGGLAAGARESQGRVSGGGAGGQNGQPAGMGPAASRHKPAVGQTGMDDTTKWYMMLARMRKTAKERSQADADANDHARALGMRPDFHVPRASRLAATGAHTLDPLGDVKIPFAINRSLRAYQRVGVQFFYERWKGWTLHATGQMMHGGVLGDDMGLGKTVQVIAFLSAIMGKSGTMDDASDERLRKTRARDRVRLGLTTAATSLGPTCLIVCPTSLLDNWKRELETWGYFSFEVYEGRRNPEPLKRYGKGWLDIVLTSHATLRSAHEQLSSVHFSVVIVDEAHTLKNKDSGLTAAAKQLKADSKFALTGTLVQNRYSEMWSVLDFIAPTLLGTKRDWDCLIGKRLEDGNKLDAKQEQIDAGRALALQLRDEIMPQFFLRRTKAEVATELPEKNDQVVFCPITPVQEICYERLSLCKPMQGYLHKDDPCSCGKRDKEGNSKPRRKCCFKPDEDDPNYGKLVLRFISILRKLSSHLALLYPQANDTPAQNQARKDLFEVIFPNPDIGADDEDSLAGPAEPQDFDARYRSLDAYQAGRDVNLSGKWIVLRTLLQAWHSENASNQAENKVLVFSSSVRLLNLLEEFADTEAWSYATLTGSIAGKDRMVVVDQFQKNPKCFIFFISTLAGGVGLNLTAANKVIIFDPSWNPANDLQAMDRAFRMGQKRDVDVYRLIAKGTLEENIYERQLRKESAMRIAYDASDELRVWKGTERDRGTQTDLYGVQNMFTYHREGTTLQRMTRALIANPDDPATVVNMNGVSTLKVETSYVDEVAWATEETDEGNQQILDAKKDNDLLLDFLGMPPVNSAGLAMDELAKANPGLITRQHIRTDRKTGRASVKEETEVTTSQFSRRQAGPAATELPRAPTNLTLKGQIALVSDDED